MSITAEEARQLAGWVSYVRSRIKTSRLYGIPVDEDSEDHMIVAAYFRGILERDDKETYRRVMEIVTSEPEYWKVG
jgi:hypothetical protein